MKQQAEEPLEDNIEVVTPGILLQEARISAQLTVSDIAKKLNLKASLIEAIENSDFEEIASKTFARGYLKAYAKLVHVDENEVLEAFEHLNTAEQQHLDMQSFSHRASKKTADNWLSIISFLVFMTIVVGVVIWWYQRPVTQAQLPQPSTVEVAKVNDEVKPDQPEQSEPETLETEAATETQAEINHNEPQLSPAGELLASEEELGSQDADIQSQSTETAETESTETALSEVVDEQIDEAGMDESSSDIEALQTTQGDDSEQPQAAKTHLELRFSDSCWINIEDATGERVAIGTKTKGHYTSVYGVAPFTIKLGKPDVVSIWLEGEPQQIPYYPKGSIANFELSVN